MNKKQSGFAPIVIILIIAGILAAGGGVYYLHKNSNYENLLASLTASQNTEEMEDYVATSIDLKISNSPESERAKELSIQVLQLKNQIKKESGKTRETTINSMRQALRERREKLEKLVEKDPLTTLTLIIPRSIFSQLPQEVQGEVEKEITIEGQLETLIIDDFQNKKAEYKYTLKSGDKSLSFYPVGQQPALISGSKVKIKGFQIGENKLLAPVGSNTFQVLQEQQSEAVGDQKTLVVLLNFLDSGSPPFTKEQAKDLVFNGQMQAFYKEASYGQVSFSGDVIGWHTIPRNGFREDGQFDWPHLGGENDYWGYDEVYKFVKNNVDLRIYQRLILLVDHPNAGGGFSNVGRGWSPSSDSDIRLSTAWIGLTNFSDPSGWGNQPFNWTNLDYILSHELGHSLGVLHANHWDCGKNKVLYGICSHQEYGNFYDVMGTMSYSLHFNALFKDALGWLNRSILSINRSGRYTINPIELQSGIKAAKIINPYLKNTYYYVEYRKGVGFDAGLNNSLRVINQSGLFINWAPKLLSGMFSYSRLLDISPLAADSEGWDDWSSVTLLKSEKSQRKFTDKGRGVVIGPVISNNDSSITFNVVLTRPRCIRNNPYLQGYNMYLSGFPEDKLTAMFSFQNLDSPICPSSNFQIEVKPPLGWSYDFDISNILSLQPEDDTFWRWVTFDIPVKTLSGEYPYSITVKNLNSKKITTISGKIYVNN
jgi:hypothetical protein